MNYHFYSLLIIIVLSGCNSNELDSLNSEDEHIKTESISNIQNKSIDQHWVQESRDKWIEDIQEEYLKKCEETNIEDCPPFTISTGKYKGYICGENEEFNCESLKFGYKLGKEKKLKTGEDCDKELILNNINYNNDKGEGEGCYQYLSEL